MEAAAEMTFHFALAFCKMMLTPPSFPHRTRHFLLVIAPVLAGPGCVILIHRPNLEQIRSRESDTSPSSSLFFMFVRLAISSRNVAIARIEPMRTPFGDLQKREEGLIKEALLLTGSPWSSMPLFCLAATDVACPLAWSCGCRQ